MRDDVEEDLLCHTCKHVASCPCCDRAVCLQDFVHLYDYTAKEVIEQECYEKDEEYNE